jgi:hypothetical protein
MNTSGILKQEEPTPLCELFVAGGAICEIQTNSESILKAAGETLIPVVSPDSTAEFCMRFWVDSRTGGQAPWPKPYVRALDHLVFAGFDSGSSVLVNLRSCRAIGRFSSSLAADQSYWKEVIFPMMLSIASGALGIAELHCACVAKNQHGMLLAGPSHSGKSTLSLALGQAGFGFLSDDRTFCSLRAGRLSAWGMPVLLKLRREAAAWFPELRDRKPGHMQKGEPVFRCQPGETLRFERVQICEPRLLIFLEQKPGSEFQFTRMPHKDAAALLAADLMMELPKAVGKQTAIIDRLVDLPCWHLAYDATPRIVAERLSLRFDRLVCLS